MAKRDEVPMYPCMMPPRGLRRVSDPREERLVTKKRRLRRLFSRLAAAVRA